MQSNFLIGTIHISEGAKTKLQRIPYDLIARHAVNEHGLLTKREAHCNLVSMKNAGEIMSRYPINPTDARQGNVLVVTRESWDLTLVKLEDE